MSRLFVIMGVVFSLCPVLYGQQGRKPFSTPQDAVRYYEELVGNLTRQVKSMQDENAIFVEETTKLKSRVARLEQENDAVRKELAALRQQIAADAEVRKDQLNRLADRLGNLSAPPPVHQEKRQKKGKTPPPPPPAEDGEEEFLEHTVEAGTTLHALAKVYGVSVKEIIRANKLSGSRIYVGQKLLIPIPKKR